MNSSPADTHDSDDAGSTVIEIIIAFAIVSIALIHGFELISASARSGAAMREKVSGLSLAENQLAALRSARSADAIENNGRTSDDYDYSIALTPVPSLRQSQNTDVTQAFRVTVTVSRAGREVIRLESWALFPFDRQ